MSTVFIIVDCSGSVCAGNDDNDGAAAIAKINDLVRDITVELRPREIKVVIYSDKAELFWESGKGAFTDIPESKFGGRSNLGSAYNLLLTSYSNRLTDSVLALISDGEATDNYKKYLDRLNKMKVTARTALSTGSSTYTTGYHAMDFDHEYKFDSRNDFIEKIAELAE